MLGYHTSFYLVIENEEMMPKINNYYAKNQETRRNLR